MGASAVLLFAVPASPMAQPWPIIGGNSLSALTGFAVGEALGHGAIACGIGVGLAIGVMSVTRSLHPPGGAAALTGVIGGSLVSDAGWWFPLAPVALDAVVLVARRLGLPPLLRPSLPAPQSARLADRGPAADGPGRRPRRGPRRRPRPRRRDLRHRPRGPPRAALPARAAGALAPPPRPELRRDHVPRRDLGPPRRRPRGRPQAPARQRRPPAAGARRGRAPGRRRRPARARPPRRPRSRR